MANDTLPFALMVKSYGTVSVNGKVNDADLDYLDKVANGTITDVDKNALTSRVFGRAAVITDVGISFAKELETAGQKWSLGVTPKYQRVDLFGFAPIFPDICYHLTHYKPAAADIPVASDNPAHYADAIRYNARTPLQGSLLPLTRLVWA